MGSFYTYSAQTCLYMICTWTAFLQQHIHSSLSLEWRSWQSRLALHCVMNHDFPSHISLFLSSVLLQTSPTIKRSQTSRNTDTLHTNTLRKLYYQFRLFRKVRGQQLHIDSVFEKNIYIVRKSFYNKMEKARKGNFDQFYHKNLIFRASYNIINEIKMQTNMINKMVE